MKKFVIMFLLLVVSFSTFAQTAAETTPDNSNLVQIESVATDTVVETFAINLDDPLIVSVPLPSEEDILCMQQNIFFEARNQGERGMKAVAKVTMNRTRDPNYPDTICGVVREQKRKGTCQFSWFCDKRLRSGPTLFKQAEILAWELAGKIAHLAAAGKIVSIVGNATHYHATYVHPKWSRHLKVIARIGTHIFYK